MAEVSYLRPEERTSIGLPAQAPSQTSSDFLSNLRPSDVSDVRQVNQISTPYIQTPQPNLQQGAQFVLNQSNPNTFLNRQPVQEIPNFESPSQDFFGDSIYGVSGQTQTRMPAMKDESEFKNIMLSINDYNNYVKNNPYGDVTLAQRKRENIMSLLDTTPGIVKDGNNRIISTGNYIPSSGKQISLNGMGMDIPPTKIFFQPTPGATSVPTNVMNENKDSFTKINEELGFQQGVLSGKEQFGKDVKNADISPFLLSDKQRTIIGDVDKSALDFAKESGYSNPLLAFGSGVLQKLSSSFPTSEARAYGESLREGMTRSKESQLKDVKVTELSTGPVLELGAQLTGQELQGKIDNRVKQLKNNETQIKSFESSLYGNRKDLLGTTTLEYGTIDENGRIIQAGTAYSQNDIDTLNSMKQQFNDQSNQLKPSIDILKKINVKLGIEGAKYEDITQAYQSGLADTQFTTAEKLKESINAAPYGLSYALQPIVGAGRFLETGSTALAAPVMILKNENKGQALKNVLSDPRVEEGAINLALLGLAGYGGYTSTIDKFSNPITSYGETAKAVGTGQKLGQLDVIRYPTSKVFTPVTKQILSEAGITYGLPLAIEGVSAMNAPADQRKSFSQSVKDALEMGGNLQVLTTVGEGATQLGSMKASSDIKNVIQKAFTRSDIQGTNFVVAETPESYLPDTASAKADIKAVGENTIKTKYGDIPIRLEARTTNIQGKSIGEKIPMSALGTETRTEVFAKFPGQLDYSSMGEGYISGNKLIFAKQQSLVPSGYMDQFKNYLKDMGYNDEQVKLFIKGREPGPVSLGDYGESYMQPSTREQIIDNFKNKYGLGNVQEVKSSGYSIAYPEGSKPVSRAYSERMNVYSKDVENNPLISADDNILVYGKGSNKPTIFASGKSEVSSEVSLSPQQEAGLRARIVQKDITENPVMDIQRAGQQYSRISPTTRQPIPFTQTIQDNFGTLRTNIPSQQGSKLSYGYSGSGEDMNIDNLYRELGYHSSTGYDVSKIYTKAGKQPGQQSVRFGVSKYGVPESVLDIEQSSAAFAAIPRTQEYVVESLVPEITTQQSSQLLGTSLRSNAIGISDNGIITQNVRDILSSSKNLPSLGTSNRNIFLDLPLDDTSKVSSPMLEVPSYSSGDQVLVSQLMTTPATELLTKPISQSIQYPTNKMDQQTKLGSVLVPDSYKGTDNIMDTKIASLTESGTDTDFTSRLVSLYGLTELTKIPTTVVPKTVPNYPTTGVGGGLPITAALPFFSLPGSNQIYGSGSGFYPKKSMSPIANYKIFFKRKFGFMGTPDQQTRTVNITSPKYMTSTGSDVGDFGKRIKELI